MKKRFVAFLLVLIMVLGMLPVSAMAAGSSVVSPALYPDFATREASGKDYPAVYTQAGDEYGTVVVAPNDTVTDEGKLYYWIPDSSGVGETTSFSNFWIDTNTNPSAVEAAVSQNSDGTLKVTFNGKQEGKATVKIVYSSKSIPFLVLVHTIL